MPLQIIRQDITRMRVDAIVNPTNSRLFPTGGTDAAIHLAAGLELWSAVRALGGCDIGQAKVTAGYALPCRYVIHTAGPQWQGGGQKEEELLISCYRECLKKALELHCESVAIPLISSGSYGYPKDRVLKVAVRVISDFLFEHEMLVYLVVYDKQAYQFSQRLFSDIVSFIDDNCDEVYSCMHPGEYLRRRERADNESGFESILSLFGKREDESVSPPAAGKTAAKSFAEKRAYRESAFAMDEAKREQPENLQEFLKKHDDTFAVTLSKLIDAKGMSDAACYKKSNVSKKTFWKIMNQENYHPSKNTVLCFAIGLELNLEETLALLKTTGFTLSHSDTFDLIIEFFIRKGNYDIFEINETLFEFDLPCLGGVVA